MITFIRRIIGSKIGAIIALLFILFMGLAFALSDVNSFMGGSSGVSGGNVARVGDRQISSNELRQRVQRAYEQARQQQQGLTIQQFVASGGMDRVLTEMVDIYALEAYAREHGLAIDKLAVDAAITQIPAFAGINGSFDQATFEDVLRRSGLSERDVRSDIESRAIVRQLVGPLGTVPAIPQQMALAYAGLLLEQRQGQAMFVPSSRLAPTTTPSDAVLTRYYTSQRARYTIPERRAIRVALLDESAIRTPPAVTDAEIAADFRANAAEYAASESRRLTQVIAGTRAAADRIAAAARSGQTLAAAAQAGGLAAAPVNAESRAAYTNATNAAAAQAVFAAEQGAIVGPVQVPLGWAVVRVEAIDRRPAQTLADATPAIRTRLAERKRQEALQDLYNRMQDALNGGASVTEVATEHGLTVQSTPPLLADGQAPGVPNFRADPLLPALLGPAFQAAEGEPAQIVTLQPNRVFALVEVAQRVPAAPPPFAQLRERVLTDWRLSEGARLARDQARAVVAAVERGTAFATAVQSARSSAGVQTIGGRRINLTNPEGRVPPEIALLFAMEPGTARTLELPGNAGWMVIYLNAIQRDDASSRTELVAAVREQFRAAIGSEYVAALVAAARAEMGVETDDAAVATLRRELSGTATRAN